MTSMASRLWGSTCLAGTPKVWLRTRFKHMEVPAEGDPALKQVLEAQGSFVLIYTSVLPQVLIRYTLQTPIEIVTLYL